MKKKMPATAKKKTATAAPASAAAKSKPSKAIAIAALLINIFSLLPGLGTIIGGKIKTGMIQLFLLWLGGILLALIGFVQLIESPIIRLIFAMVGSVILLAGWVWAIISGIFIIRKASL